MNQRKFDKLQAHYLKYFGAEEEPKILHSLVDEPGTLHIDMIYLRPTTSRPYQVLATIGASDYPMKPKPHSLTNRNEYVTFLPSDWDLSKPECHWIVPLLAMVSHYPHDARTMISYSHTMDCSSQMEDLQSDTFNMCGAGLLFPQICEDPNILRCKTGLFETVTILQMMPLTRAEMDEIIKRRKQRNPDWTDMFYPESGSDSRFLCACKR